jgi:phage-related protein
MMSSRAAELAIRLTEDGADATAAGLDKVGSAADTMGSKVEAAGRSAEKGAAGLDTAASGADEMASKGSQAAGAMSGLGDLIGGPFGGAMATGGIGLQAMADSGDLLNAALENSVVATVRAKAATVAKSVADKASAAATRGLTLAQKALNLAQRASPIGLILTGLLLLGTLLVVAYKRSSTFRAIVQGALHAVEAAVSPVVDAFRGLPAVVRAAFGIIKTVITTYISIYVGAFKLLIKGIGEAWDVIKKTGTAAFDALKAPIQTVIDLIQSLLDKISSIHLPDIHIPGLRTGGTTVPTTTTTGGNTVVYLNVSVSAAPGATTTQAELTAQATMDAIDRRLTQVGRQPVFAR